MRKFKIHSVVRLIAILLLPIIWLYPGMAAVAETLPADSSSSTASGTSSTSTTTKTGPTKPPGPDSNTYKYNPVTGLWENDHYTWNPATNQTAPKDSPKYSYNPTTNMWDTTKWRYDAPSGQYIPNTVSVDTPPVAAGSISSSNAPSSVANANSMAVANPSSSDPSITTNSDSSAAFNLFYNAKISNVITSTATTGSASVTQNTIGGSALSGDAQAMANIINLLQSSWGQASNGQVTTFINNIDGDVLGDLVIDPSHLPSSNLSSGKNQPNTNFNVNVQNSGSIDNKIDLSAYSGDANVDLNTSAGNANTGTANAVANVVNMINTTIASGNSFVGMININGNLNGDILLPPEMINQLLASNSVPKTTINTANLTNGSLLADINNNSSITNNVSTDAKSGNATVANNTKAGSATTGDTSNNITILNLTGHSVVGDDCLLVFVNVLGKWVGMIVNAPSGSTTAALGGGISQNTISNVEGQINAQNNSTINNDINLAAHSGNANVTNNTLAGNATTGDASTSANLLNIIDTNLSLSKWFGILFINVFGSWQGSFGMNTSAGNKAVLPKSVSHNEVGSMKVFRFVPNSNGGASLSNVYSSNSSWGSSNSSNSSDNSAKNAVLASSHGGSKGQPQEILSRSIANSANSAWLVAGVSIALGLSILGSEQILSRRSLSR